VGAPAAVEVVQTTCGGEGAVCVLTGQLVAAGICCQAVCGHSGVNDLMRDDPPSSSRSLACCDTHCSMGPSAGPPADAARDFDLEGVDVAEQMHLYKQIQKMAVRKGLLRSSPASCEPEFKRQRTLFSFFASRSC
jgi:hypothetical protein